MMKRLRWWLGHRLLWDAPPRSIEAIHRDLLRYKRRMGGKPLGLS